jgi:outer membrane protein
MLAALCVLCAVTTAPAQEQAPHLLTLDEAMRLAVERNPSIEVARSGAEAARASLDGQRGRRLPNLSFDANARISESLSRDIVVGGDTVRSGGGRSETSDLQLTLTHTFYQSGREQAIAEQRWRTRASELGVANARRQLLVEVAGTFYGVLAQQELAEVADQAVAAAEQHLDLVDARIEAGTVAPADRLTVEAELADAEFEAVRTVNAVWTRLSDLRALLALPADELPLIRGDLQTPRATGDLEEWIADALQARPDLQAQRHRVRASELALEQAKIDAGLSLSVQGQADYGRHTGETGDTWFIGGGLSFPLFDKQARASVDAAQANLESTRQSLAEQELSVSRQVSSAWYGLRDATGRVVAAEASVAASATNLEAARERYVEGVANIIEVTDAEVSWRRARGNLVQARYDRNVAWYQLLAAAGRPLLNETAGAGEPADTDQPDGETVGD